MLVSVTGFGSVWRHRIPVDHDRVDSHQCARAVYYNTTGVPVSGILRSRPRIVGHIRFNSLSGLDPNYPLRAVHRVFECAEPCIWKGQNKLLFNRRLAKPRPPDTNLVVLRSGEVGRVKVGTEGWKSEDVWVISFSEDSERQEVMLLMPARSWVRSDLGKLVLESDANALWRTRIRLEPMC
jgi:hypothetical protein